MEQLDRRELLAAMSVGMNLEDVVDWSPAWVFTDAFKSSRNWTSHSYNTVTRVLNWSGGADVPVSVDEHGWPTRLASWTNELGQRIEQRLGTLMFSGLNGNYAGGIYRAEWDGAGTLFWGHDARAIETGRTTTGRNFALLQVTPGNGGIYMRIDAIDPQNPIRNVNVWMPDYNGQSFAGQQWRPGANFSPFHPLFLERLSPFSTIRAIHPSDTITSDIQHWSDRREVDDARQSTALDPFQNGLAPEYLIELSNELDADLWINMPHMADDDYVRNMATLVRDTLEPGRKVYVEWSNEVWNFAPGFEATFWVRDQTLLPENAGLSHYQIAGREAKRDLDIWSQVFAGQDGRLVRVAGGFAAVPSITNQIVQSMGGSFDAIAIAPYIGPNADLRAGYTAATTADQVLNDTQASIAFMADRTREHRAMAESYGAQFGRHIELVTYEGGPHLDGRNQPYQQAMFDAGLSPRMYGIYRDYLQSLEGAGVERYMHFNFTGRAMATQWGDFAALHRMDESLETAHKYRALVDYIASDDPPPNAIPTISDIANRTINEDATTGAIAFTVGDAETAAGSLAVSVQSSNATLVPASRMVLGGTGANRTLTISPAANQFGSAVITVTVTDGSGASASDSFLLTVNSVNDRPTISALPNQTIPAGGATAAIPLTVGDVETPAGSLTLLSASSNTTLVPPSGIVFGGSGANRTVTVRPAANQSGTATISVSVRDAGGASASRSFLLTVTGGTQSTISLAATDASAAESGRDPAVFTVIRNGGSLTQALTVNYQVGGTSNRTNDYAPLSGSVTIPSGATSATIVVTPNDDTAAEGRESVMLSLLAGGYVIGAGTALANIADNDADQLPVLMVIANQDFCYQEYADTRRSLEEAGLRVVVAATSLAVARPHVGVCDGGAPMSVTPNLRVADAQASDYSAVVFVGGWGSSAYQYGFTGTYANAAYNGDTATRQAVNQLVTDFIFQDKYLTGICHGVTALAWARVNGASPLAGRRVSSYGGGAPPSNVAGSTTTRWHLETNGATMVASRSVGDPTTATDDVLVDGKVITAENWDSARQFGRTIASYLRG